MSLGSGIRDPGSGINLFRTTDPGVKKAPDPGSATLDCGYERKRGNSKEELTELEKLKRVSNKEITRRKNYTKTAEIGGRDNKRHRN
jgi:hypothetical protein